MMAALAGATLVLGFLVVLQGLFPKQADLRTRLAEFNEVDLVANTNEISFIETLAVTLLETIKGEDLGDMLSDIAVTDSDFTHIAMEKLKGAVGCGVLLMFASSWLGFISGALGLTIVGIVGLLIGYKIPDMELKKKADAEIASIMSKARKSSKKIKDQSV